MSIKSLGARHQDSHPPVPVTLVIATLVGAHLYPLGSEHMLLVNSTATKLETRTRMLKHAGSRPFSHSKTVRGLTNRPRL